MLSETAAELTKPDTGLMILMVVGNIVAIVGTGVGVAWKMRDKIDSKVKEVESSLDKKIDGLKKAFEAQNKQNKEDFEKRNDELKGQVEKNREEFQVFKADFPKILNGTYTRAAECSLKHDAMKEHFDDLKGAVAEVRRELREYAAERN